MCCLDGNSMCYRNGYKKNYAGRHKERLSLYVWRSTVQLSALLQWPAIKSRSPDSFDWAHGECFPFLVTQYRLSNDWPQHLLETSSILDTHPNSISFYPILTHPRAHGKFFPLSIAHVTLAYKTALQNILEKARFLLFGTRGHHD